MEQALDATIGGSLDVIIPENLRAVHKHGGKLYVELTFGIIKGGPQGVMGRSASMSTDE